PAAPSHTGNGSPAPSTPVHTGTNVRQADSIVVTTFPADVVQDLQDFILWQPDATEVGVEAIYVMVSKPYGETNAKGKYSGRDYNTDKAGGPIQNLDWKGASIDRAGVDKVELHTGRFGESPDNKVMIDRLEKILKGELQATDTDKRFYTHEIRELERYRALGVSDGVSDDSVWNSAHTATLEDYKINEKNQPMYTPEALEAYRKAEEGK
ncbi:S-type pyocin domain-containing protein, partial [Serratia ficaria]|uniref:S-type pyocin domain-containing protein n=1 Tax=Serratia ficaria TaxID=61651 RepID=UPI002ED69469|nr:S-type pyocin domain-containing protein [Serratia ficaria]